MTTEDAFLLALADYFFLVFHSGLILFNLFGWYWPVLRKWHLLSISLTFASWIVLGFWYGWGYCPLTDWHWDILQKRGAENLPHSYISYLLERITGLSFPDRWVDFSTLTLALLALVISIKVNYSGKHRG